MLPLNQQTPERQEIQEDGSLDVHSIFYTIQGEGPFAGRPAVFVRLAGCNLQCPCCDTEYTSGRIRRDVMSLVLEICETVSLSLLRSLVVLTGGEPFRQRLGSLVQPLLDWKAEVQIETNGTLYDPSLDGLYSDISVICSPKTPVLARELLPHIDAYKYILAAGQVDEEDGLPTHALGMPCRPARPHPGFAGEVFVQPQDDGDPERNVANVKAAVVSCMKYGYRLSYQLHKLLGMD